jgi:hypothetical protein
MAGKLIAHCGAEYIDREGLRTLETPPATDTWTPIPHYDLVVALEGQLRARNINIIKEQFAVQKAKLFGVLDTDYQVSEEGGAAIGIRTANDKSLALQLAIGYRIFICDNMAFHGDLIALRRKHTAHLDLHKEFAEGIGRYVREYSKLEENINWWKERVVSKERGKQLIYDIFSQRLVPCACSILPCVIGKRRRIKPDFCVSLPGEPTRQGDRMKAMKVSDFSVC